MAEIGLWGRVLWILMGSFQYGYHISALNALQKVMSCQEMDSENRSLWACVPMTDTIFGIVTASYTLGGLAGSFYSDKLISRRGKRSAVILAAVFILLGAIILSLAPNPLLLFIGRMTIGVGCGVNLCVVPLFLAELAPESIKGLIGVTNQLGICTGILVAQALSLGLSYPIIWRCIPVISGAFALLQIIIAHSLVEKPAANLRGGDNSSTISRDETTTGATVGGNDNDVEEPLLSDEVPSTYIESEVLSIPELFRSKEGAIRRGLIVILLTQITQQACGINAVLYYSTSIMSKVVPDGASYLALLITLVNLVSTFPTALLVDRVGRRKLLLISGIIMCFCHAGLAYTINTSRAIIASVMIITIVIGFSVGLGPIPFVIIGEIMPLKASGSACSVGTCVNWVTNFAVGALFLPLRNLLSIGDGKEEGNVFFIFAIITGIATILIGILYQSSSRSSRDA